MKTIQKRVDNWSKKLDIGYWKPHEILARVIEEVGELAREINHRFGPKKKKKSEAPGNLELEIADIIFALVCLANSLNIDLDKAFEKMMNKIETRDKDRWKKK